MSLKPSLEVPAVAGAVERVVVRIREGQASTSVDHVAVEEPLEIRLAGMSLAVTMRTPGDDEELVAGFLYSERVIARRRRPRRHRAAIARPDSDGRRRQRDERPAGAQRRRRARSGCAATSWRRPRAVSAARSRSTPSAPTLPPVVSDLIVPSSIFHRLERAMGASPGHVREDRRPARGGALRRRRHADRAARGHRPPQRGRQGHRPHAAGPPAAARSPHPDGQRPGQLRDHAEGPDGADPDRGGGVGALQPGGRDGASPPT